MHRTWHKVGLAAVLLVGACTDREGSDATTTTVADDAATTTEGEGGSSSTETFATLPPGTVGPVASGEFTFTGAIERSGTYEVLYPVTDERLNRCERISGADAGAYAPPAPTIVGDARLVWRLALRQYPGPGSYDLGALGPVAVELVEGQATTGRTFSSGGASTVELTVDEANNGTVAFAGFATEGGEELSGSFTWTCTNG